MLAASVDGASCAHCNKSWLLSIISCTDSRKLSRASSRVASWMFTPGSSST
jgi:hypothetical protein